VEQESERQECLAEKIQVLIIEDNPLLREGISAIIKRQSDIKVVSGKGRGKKPLQMISDLKPNVLLLDLGLRSQSSLEIVKVVKKDFPQTKIIVMDLVATEVEILMFVRAGVSGFVLKDATTVDFLKTIRAVARGKKVLPPLMTGSLFSQIVEQAINGTIPPRVIEAVRMTKRERQVILLIADGLSNKEIANKLHLSTYTVKSHVHNILEKLLLQSRVQIAKYALTNSELMKAEESISFIEE
jgi:DNA-binding NarL/FixJ family response regulator